MEQPYGLLTQPNLAFRALDRIIVEPQFAASSASS
jgi:hypothetical protein